LKWRKEKTESPYSERKGKLAERLILSAQLVEKPAVFRQFTGTIQFLVPRNCIIAMSGLHGQSPTCPRNCIKNFIDTLGREIDTLCFYIGRGDRG
jgi:hypothetical protein